MTFKKAVEATPAIAAHLKPGLQALSHGHRRLIRCSKPKELGGSIDLDDVLRSSKPRDARWDYGLGFRKPQVVWIEVHPASSSHVAEVLNKLNWLRSWLKNEAPALCQLKARFIWLPTGSVALPANSPKRKVLAAAGLLLKTVPLNLDLLGH